MNHIKPACLIVTVILAFGTACSKSGVAIEDAGKAKGKIFTVDNSGDAGQFVSIDIDVNDKVHMVYYDKKNKALKYVRQSAAGFAAATVDDTCINCLYATIKVTGKGEPHLAYYSDATQTFTYAYKKGSEWKKEPIEWGKGTGMGARLLFDEKFQLHALYYSGDGFLKHGWRILRKDAPKVPEPKKTKKTKKTGTKTAVEEETEGLWGNERVDKANGSEKVQISFVRNPQGGLATSYFHWSGMSSELRVAIQQQDGSWSSQIVAKEDNPGKSSELFFTNSKEPRIIFREAMKNRLSIAKASVEGWQSSPFLEDVYNMALDADAGGDLLIAYEKLSGRDPRKGNLCYVLRKAGKWTRYEVDPAKGSGTHLDAIFTSSSGPVIAYYEETGHSLKLFIAD
ncbi:MAG: hypothetical protein JRJ19_06305 [Deltaproteobacteria bacterium]|nr:hypothetical protein [Deltaproteobacteria bacterium]